MAAAGSHIGMASVARADGDGYTLFLRLSRLFGQSGSLYET